MRKTVASVLLLSLLLTTNLATAATSGSVGFGSNSSGTSGSVGFGSNPNSNGSVGFGSSSSNNGSVGFATQSQNSTSGSVGFTSSNPSSNGSVGFGSSSSNNSGSVGFSTQSQSGTSGSVGFGSSNPSSNGSIGFVSSSSNSNGSVGFGSNPSSNGSIGFGSSTSNTNGSVGFGSSNQNGSVGFGGSNTNGSIGFGNSNTNGSVGFGNNNNNGSVGFGNNNTNGSVGFPNTLPTVRLLEARNITNTSATVFYNGSDADGDMLTYEVCLDDAPDNNSNYIPTFNNCQNTSNEFFNFTGLTANNMYMWTVRVRDSGGLGDTQNGPMSFTTLQNAPANNIPTVTLGSVTSLNDTSATLNWSVSDPDGTAGHQYDVCYSVDRNNVYNSCRFTTTSTSYTLSNITPGTTYYWSIRVRDGVYTVFPDSGMSSFTTTGFVPSNNPPAVLLGTATGHTSTSVTLNWTGMDQDAGETFTYSVCFGTNRDLIFQNCVSAGTATTLNLSNLTPNTTYFWDVKVSDGTYPEQFSLNGPLSFRTDPSSSTNNSPTATLVAPTTASTVTSATVNLQWSATDVDAGDQANLIYELYAMSVAAGATAPTQSQIIQAANRVTLPSNTATSYTYTTTNNTDVYWTVQVSDQRNPAYFPAQNGPFNFLVRFNTTNNNVPDFVNGSFAPTDNQTFTTTTPVTLTWNATDADADPLTYALYVVNQARNAAAPSLATVMDPANRVTLSANNATSHVLNVVDDRAYYWVVTVTDNRVPNPIVAFAAPRLFIVNTTATGNTAPVVTLVTPGDTTTQPIQANYALTWSVADDNAANVRYTVYAREVSQTTVLQPSDLVQDQYIVTSNLNALTFDRAVTPGNRLYWTVRATDGAFTPLANNGPFYFDVQAGNGNNTAPVVTLVSPINGGTVNPAASYRLAWNVQDDAPANVRYEVYGREVSASTVLTRADVEQAQYLVAANLTNTFFDVIVGNGNRYYWSVRAVDGAFTPYATNGAFMFTVAPNTVNNLTTELALLNNGTVQTSFGTGQTPTVRLRLINNGSIAQTISFPTTQEYDIVIVNTTTGQIVRQASVGMNPTNTVTTRTLGAGATQEYTWSWDLRDQNGALVPAGNYRVEGYILSTSPLISVAPVTITVTGTQPGNLEPFFTGFAPTNGSVFNTTAQRTLSWTATDPENNPITYDLFVLEQTIGSTAPSLATLMNAANRRTLTSANATSFDLTVQDQRVYYWIVTANDGTNPTVVPGAAPFAFTINTGATANNAATVRLDIPADDAIFTTTANVQFTWTPNDLDGNTVTTRLYVRELPLNDTTVYTNADIMQAQYLRNGNTISVLDQRRYVWTVDATDGIMANPVGAFNGPRNFTVNTQNNNVQNLTWDVLVSTSTGNTSQVVNYALTDPIVARVTATNSSATPQVLNFASTNRKTRITITNVTLNQVFYDSNLTINPDSLPSTVTVPANGSFTFEVYTWDGIRQNIGTGRVAGDYRVAAEVYATNATVSVPTRTITLAGPAATGGNTGGGGGGGGSTGGGSGSGGGGIGVDTTTVLQLPTVGSDSELIWYGPINFAPSNGQVNRPIRHVEYNSGFSANWERGTIVTDKAGNRFLGTYYPISRYKLDKLQEPMKGALPTGLSYLDEYFTQYGTLAEKYSKPVKINGSLAKAPRELMSDVSKLAILGWDFETGKWVKLGDASNFTGRFYTVETSKSTIIAVVDTSKVGTVIPGGPNIPDTDPNDSYGADACLNTNLARTPFGDANSHWSAYYICRLYKMGAISGYLDGPLAGRFNPEGSVTRAELLTSIMKLYGYDVSNARTSNLFPDVSANEWYTAYISKARDLGIVAGYPDGNFRPHQPVNRAEAMKMILLAAKNIDRTNIITAATREREDFDNVAGFVDVPESAWYSAYVSFARSAGIINGKANGNFAAGDSMTRAEMTKVIFLTYTKPSTSTIPQNCTTGTGSTMSGTLLGCK